MDFIRNLSVRAQILGVTSVLSLLLLLVAGVGISKMVSVGNELERVAEEDLPILGLLSQIEEAQLEQAVLQHKALYVAAAGGAKAEKLSDIRGGFEDADQHIEEAMNQAENRLEQAAAHSLSAEEAEKLDSFRDNLQGLHKTHEQFFQDNLEVFDDLQAGNLRAAEEKLAQVEKQEAQLEDDFRQLHGQLEAFTEHAASEAKAEEERGVTILVVVSVLALAVGAFLGWLVSRGIDQVIQQVSQAMRRAADEHDLTVQVNVGTRNKLGQMAESMNHMVAELRSLFSNWREEGNHLATATQELSSTSQELTTDARKSSQQVESVTQSAQEVNEVVHDVANNISSVSEAANKTDGSTKQGKELVDQASSRLDQLKSSSDRVDEVVATIQSIAKKTDLLALNAAIEAANAGEQGKGFAVVADEVRKLAEQTSQATTQVSEIMTEIKDHSDSSVGAMDQVQTQMAEIFKNIEHTDKSANQIASAAEELASTMSETTESMNEIHATVEHVASSVEQIDQATSQLENTATSLDEGLRRFSV